MPDTKESRVGTALPKRAVLALCILLLAVARMRSTTTLTDSLANGLSGLLIAAGVALALRGPDKLRRLAELYLWLAFIVSLSLLKILTDALAQQLSLDPLATLQTAGVVHAVIAAACLGILGAWLPASARPQTHSYPARLAAGLLIFGAVVFWIGARTFPGTDLPSVAASLGGHLWTAGNFLLAILITLIGLGLLTQTLRNAGDRTLALLALATITFGSVFWVLHLAFRLTVMRTAAEELTATGAVPSWYLPWIDASGLLFGLFSALAYLAIAAYGGAVLRTRLLPRWLGWTCLVVGLAAAPTFGPPFFIHTVLWIVGMTVLTAPRLETI